MPFDDFNAAVLNWPRLYSELIIIVLINKFTVSWISFFKNKLKSVCSVVYEKNFDELGRGVSEPPNGWLLPHPI